MQNTMKCLKSVTGVHGNWPVKNVLAQNIDKKICATFNGNGSKLHVSAIQNYPQVVPLPLPPNIDPTETTRFSPQRARDINSTAILSHHASVLNRIDITIDTSTDPRANSYDCTGAISLNSSMQSNVPSPFSGVNNFTHLNMPGGQWGQESKFMSNDLNSSHYINLRREVRSNWSKNYSTDVKATKKANNAGTLLMLWQNRLNKKSSINNAMLSSSVLLTNACCSSSSECFLKITRQYSTMHQKQQPKNVDDIIDKNNNNNDILKADENADKNSSSKTQSLSRKEKLKKAVKEYGSTVIIFHVGISLVSLGVCYSLVSSGINVVEIFEYIGWKKADESLSKLTTGASTFVVAYAVHKVFAPIRISITLGATPFIVRYLRQKGILKLPTK